LTHVKRLDTTGWDMHIASKNDALIQKLSVALPWRSAVIVCIMHPELQREITLIAKRLTGIAKMILVASMVINIVDTSIGASLGASSSADGSSISQVV
jgi:hypothetical protein